MKVSFELTARKVFTVLGWTAVGAVLLCVLVFMLDLVFGRSDPTGAGMIVVGIIWIAMQYFYLAIIPVLVVGIGVARDAKAGKSVVFSIFKWLAAGIALYVVVLAFILSNILSTH